MEGPQRLDGGRGVSRGGVGAHQALEQRQARQCWDRERESLVYDSRGCLVVGELTGGAFQQGTGRALLICSAVMVTTWALVGGNNECATFTS